MTQVMSPQPTLTLDLERCSSRARRSASLAEWRVDRWASRSARAASRVARAALRLASRRAEATARLD